MVGFLCLPTFVWIHLFLRANSAQLHLAGVKHITPSTPSEVIQLKFTVLCNSVHVDQFLYLGAVVLSRPPCAHTPAARL